MRCSTRVKPIGYFKANAAEVLQGLAQGGDPLLITQNGQARAVLQEVVSFEQTEGSLALLKLLAIGNRDIESGPTRSAPEIVARLKGKARSG